MKLTKTFFLTLIGLTAVGAFAQEFSADLQIRPRYEYANGFKTLLTSTTSHNSFIGQRTRATLNYNDDQLTVKTSFQNVRTWGSVSTVGNTSSSTANGVALFEGWAEYAFTTNFSVKAGRQPLSYDNQRIIGGLDWANQGRSFDAALLKFKGAAYKLDLGLALNEDSELLTDPSTAYSTDFKNMQYAHFHTDFDKAGLSLLALNIGREYTNSDSEIDLAFMQTIGTYFNFKNKKFSADASLYLQTGKIGENKVTAFEGAANLGYTLTEKLSLTAGYEYLSGKDQTDTSTDISYFTPLFGTNHAFNGYMDYFYVGSSHGNVGLQDASLKFDFPIKKVKVSATGHYFSAANELSSSTDKYLGTELDVTGAYKLNKNITVIGGYSQMFASDEMVALKGGSNNTTNNWAWLMVNINPQIFSTKK
jgi:hypothetical protein